ncbi:MAG: hypothetical protein PHW66_06355 [Gallionella sp.]|nr:hypothetical protein [Gallionella sp.]
MNTRIRRRFNLLSRHGCAPCRYLLGVHSPAVIHHLVGLEYRATGKKADDMDTIPLCPNHHDGAHGIHHLGKKAWEKLYGPQSMWLERVNRWIEEGRAGDANTTY